MGPLEENRKVGPSLKDFTGFSCLLRMELIFVYNANSGIRNALKDAAHKFFSSGSYPCSLCALTWGPVSKRRKWARFCSRDLRIMQFLHKDEFETRFGQRFEYPLVLEHVRITEVESTNKQPALSVCISREQLNSMRSLDELIAALSENY